MAEQTVSVQQAAKIAGVSAATVRRWCRYHFLKASRVSPLKGQWIIDRRDLQKKLGLIRTEA